MVNSGWKTSFLLLIVLQTDENINKLHKENPREETELEATSSALGQEATVLLLKQHEKYHWVFITP